MARPKKEISEKQVMELAAINCSYAEMAAVLDCDESTLTRRFAQVIQKGRAQMRMSLKRKQYEVAMTGDRTMLVWLGKVILEQREIKDVVPPVDESAMEKANAEVDEVVNAFV